MTDRPSHAPAHRSGVRIAPDPRVPDENPPDSTKRPSGKKIHPTTGDRVGRYVVEKLLSEGATADVYSARSEKTGELVALRVLRDDLAASQLDHFQTEALAYGLFKSEHFPRLYDLGQLPSGARYMAMELLVGQTLQQRINARSFSISAVVELGIQLSRALGECHLRGFIHCDVKPQNIMLIQKGEQFTLKLIDLGICRRITGPGDGEPILTMVPGTPPYMSPEQIRGLALDLRTDIYSAGVVLYQVLTGRLPFQGANDDQLIRALLHDPVIAPGVLRTSCPPELDRALLRALCRDRRYRYASARELRDELEWVRVKYNLASGTQSFLQTSSQPPPRPVDVLAATRRASPPQGTPVVELGPAAQVRHTLPTIPDH